MKCPLLVALAVRVGVVLVLFTGCDDTTPPTDPLNRQPESPAVTPPVTPPVAPPVFPLPPEFPPLSRDGQIYRASDTLYDFFAVSHGGSIATRYVLYDTTFSLQFSSWRFGFYEYSGDYSRADSVLTFTFDGNGGWGATGTIRGDSMFVKYNDAAAWTDFMGGWYVRSPGP